jgi:hypothetical protein
MLAVLAAPDSHLTGVTRLRIVGHTLGADGVRRILTSESLTGLRSLTLMLRPEDWPRLQDIKTARLMELSVLEATDFRLGPEDMKSFARLPWLAALTTLEIAANHHIGPEGAAALARSPYLSRLESLSLYHNYIGDRGLAALARSPKLAGLHTFCVRSNEIGDAGCIALSRSRYLMRLQHLTLSENKISPVGIAALVSSPNAASLRELDLSRNDVGPPGARHILASPHLARLERLTLWSSGLQEFEQQVVEEDMVIASWPPDPEALELRARSGDRVRL